MQHFKDSDIDSHLCFADWINENSDSVNVLWFSDGDAVIAELKKPTIILKNPCSVKRVQLGPILVHMGTIGPFFFF
jgi:hypothetical protein